MHFLKSILSYLNTNFSSCSDLCGIQFSILSLFNIFMPLCFNYICWEWHTAGPSKNLIWWYLLMGEFSLFTFSVIYLDLFLPLCFFISISYHYLFYASFFPFLACFLVLRFIRFLIQNFPLYCLKFTHSFFKNSFCSYPWTFAMHV